MVLNPISKVTGFVNRHRYIVGALLSILLTGAAVVVVALRAEEAPKIVSYWPLVLAVAASAASWWLQGLISSVLAQPHLEKLHIADMTRVYLAGAFVGGISPIRGGEIPVEVLLLRRIGLTTAQGSTIVVTRGLLNVSVVTVATAGALIFAPDLAKVGSWKLLGGAVAIGVIWALLTFLTRRAKTREQTAGEGKDPSPEEETSPVEPGRWVRWRTIVTSFLADMRGTFGLFLRPGNRRLLVISAILMLFYWAMRLSFGPLALIAAGYTGDWVPIVVAQLLLVSFVLPFAPTPGGSGAVELGFTALVGAYAPTSVVLSGVIIYAGLTHYLPTVVGGLFTGRQIFQSVNRR